MICQSIEQGKAAAGNDQVAAALSSLEQSIDQLRQELTRRIKEPAGDGSDTMVDGGYKISVLEGLDQADQLVRRYQEQLGQLVQ